MQAMDIRIIVHGSVRLSGTIREMWISEFYLIVRFIPIRSLYALRLLECLGRVLSLPLQHGQSTLSNSMNILQFWQYLEFGVSYFRIFLNGLHFPLQVNTDNLWLYHYNLYRR